MQFFLVLISFLTVLPSAHGHNQKPDCSPLFESFGVPVETVRRQREQDLQALKQHFMANPQMLFHEPVEQEPQGDGMEFYASNEFDWARGAVDHTPADAVVGFATNNVWDAAVRRDAKLVVIGDIITGPLIGQEYILRPFFEMAETRAEFLSLVQGIPARNARPELGPTQLFNTVWEQMLNNVEQSETFIGHVIERVRTNKKFGEVYAKVVSKYYKTIELVMLAYEDPRMAPVFSSPYSPAPAEGSRARLLGELLPYYRKRYSPDQWRRQGVAIPKESLTDKYYSFLASEEAYQRLRRLFVEGNVFFVRSDFANQEIYKRVAKLMKERGLKTVAVTTSNIADVISRNDEDSHQTYSNFVQATAKTFSESGIHGTIPFMQTRGCQPPHNYECHLIEEGGAARKLDFQPFRPVREDPFRAFLRSALGGGQSGYSMPIP